MPTRFAKYWTESGRGDGQGDVEKKDHQSYRRPYMMGKARGKVSKVKMDSKISFEMSLIVVEAVRGRCESFMVLTVSEIFGGLKNSSI